jgi:Ca2+-binding EF-hand superfamily protein
VALGVAAAGRWASVSASPTSRLAATALHAAETQGSQDKQAIAREWRALDTDGTGVLDWEGTRELLRRLGRRPEAMDEKAAFDVMDPSCHGEVAFPHFVKWWDSQGGGEAEQQLRALESLRL